MLCVSVQDPVRDLDVSFTCGRGVTALFGPSGAGKTSVLRAIAGLLPQANARIYLGQRCLSDPAKGTHVPAHKRNIGFVFQEDRLFPHLSVHANLMFGHKTSSRKLPVSASQIIDVLGIGALLDRRPATLSGGERQRVSIGRALMSEPALLLADEPLSALDTERKDEILTLFDTLRRTLDLPILYVSHAENEVARLADDVVLLKNGRVVAQGPVHTALAHADMARPQSVVQLTLQAHHEDGLSELTAHGHSLWVPRQPHAVGTAVRVRIAAQDVMLALHCPRDVSALNVLPTSILGMDVFGSNVLVRLQSPLGPLSASVTQRSVKTLGLSVGISVFAIVKSAALVS